MDGGVVDFVDSMIELERPGVEKKKRWEAKAVAKSASGVISEEVEREDGEWLRDLEVVESKAYS